MSLSLVARNNTTLNLSTPISLHTLSLLPIKDKAVCSRVCKAWAEIANDGRAWYSLASRLDINDDDKLSKKTGLKSKIGELVSSKMPEVRACINQFPYENLDSGETSKERYALQLGFYSALLLSRIDLCTIDQVISFQDRLLFSYSSSMENDSIFDQLIELKKYDEALKFIKEHGRVHERVGFYGTLVDVLCKDKRKEKAIEIIKKMTGGYEKNKAIQTFLDNNKEDVDSCLELIPLFTDGRLYLAKDSQLSSVIQIANYCLEKLNSLAKAQEVVKKFEGLMQDDTRDLDYQLLAIRTYLKIGESEKAYLKALKLNNEKYRQPALIEVRDAYRDNGDNKMVEHIDKILQRKSTV